MHEREIICCGASTWLKVFAWIQIVVHGICLVPVVLFLSFGITVGTSRAVQEQVDQQTKEVVNVVLVASLALLILAFLMLAFGLSMGIVLLQGTKQRNTRKLRFWLIYAAVSLVLSIALLAQDSGANAFIMWLGFIYVMCTNGFGVWVVWVHISEIEQHQRGTVGQQPPAYMDQFQYAKDSSPA